VAKRAAAIRLQTGNGGNLSARVSSKNWVVIKRSGCAFDVCTPDNLTVVNFEGQMIEGEGAASTELQTHLAIYRKRPDVAGIFHCHAPWAVACAERFDDEIPLVTLHAKRKLGGIPILRPDKPEMTDSCVAATEALMDRIPSLLTFVQAKHGIFSFSSTVTVASYHAELVEETAQIAWLVAGLAR
jgi:L-fuculose-phosphate aldolase/L-ribulose-5-phosphate 4-epimerase